MKLTAFSLVLILVFFVQDVSAQERTFVEYGTELNGYAEQFMSDSLYENRAEAEQLFDKLLSEVLQMSGSYEHPFKELERVSVQPSEDGKFRIFTWQLCQDSDHYIYSGYIQMKGAKPKIFELDDRSGEVRNPRRDVLSADDWYGALYYNIKPMSKRKKNKYYAVFGFDANSLYTRRKVVDVLYFKDGEPRFGAPVFIAQSQNRPPRTDYRFVMEYSASGNATLNYHEELEMIVYDNLIEFPSPYEQEGIAMMPDGSYQGFKLKKGKWYSVEKVFTHIQQNAPIVKPKLGDGRGKNPLLGPKN